MRVIHFLSGLAIGGKERAALRLAQHGMSAGQDHHLLLFDTPFRSPVLDFDPGRVPTHFLQRQPGIDFGFTRRVARLLRELCPDVVHAYNDPALFYAAFALRMARAHRVRLIATFHTWPSYPSRGARIATRWAASRAEFLVAVSDELSDRLLAAGWIPSCLTIWNGVDSEDFQPDGPDDGWRERLGVQANGSLIGHVARFDPIKRHEDLVDAAILLRERLPGAIFAMVGQGTTLSHIQARTRGCPSIRFIGQISNMAAFLRSLDVFVLCSTHEAAPLAMLEAMACRRAVVATSVGGIPAILRDANGELCGQLVPACNPPALAQSIEMIVLDPLRRRTLAARAHCRAADFSFTREWNSYASLYEGKR